MNIDGFAIMKSKVLSLRALRVNNPWKFKSSRPHPNDTKGFNALGIFLFIEIYLLLPTYL